MPATICPHQPHKYYRKMIVSLMIRFAMQMKWSLVNLAIHAVNHWLRFFWTTDAQKIIVILILSRAFYAKRAVVIKFVVVFSFLRSLCKDSIKSILCKKEKPNEMMRNNYFRMRFCSSLFLLRIFYLFFYFLLFFIYPKFCIQLIRAQRYLRPQQNISVYVDWVSLSKRNWKMHLGFKLVFHVKYH